MCSACVLQPAASGVVCKLKGLNCIPTLAITEK